MYSVSRRLPGTQSVQSTVHTMKRSSGKHEAQLLAHARLRNIRKLKTGELTVNFPPFFPH